MSEVAAEEDRIRAFVAFLQESQHWPAERLRVHQEELMERLVVHAWRTVPFYGERLKPLFRRRFGPHLHRWDQVAPLTRHDVQAHSDALLSTQIPPDQGSSFRYTTSGSTGQPVSVRRSQMALVADDAAQYRYHTWMGLDFERMLARLHDPRYADGGESKVYPSWTRVTPVMGHKGTRLEVNPVIEAARQLEIFRAARPAYLVSYPTNIRELARLATETPRPDDWAPRAVVATGEALTEDHRLAIEGAWHCPIHQFYGGLEIGHVAAECGAGPGYHQLPETMRADIVNDAGAAVPAGTSGRVLCTALFNYTMPMIRYEIGDLATWARQPCPCGRGLPVMASVEGRLRELIRFPDGATAWPALDLASILDPARIHRHQLVWDGAWGIELRYAAAAELDAKEAKAVSAALRKRFHADIEVSLSFRPDLVRNTTRKFATFVREPPAGAGGA